MIGIGMTSVYQVSSDRDETPRNSQSATITTTMRNVSKELEEQPSCSEPSESTRCGDKMYKIMKKRLPITRWIRTYGKSDFIADLIAGITVGLTVVPQSMAYAAIAGLSPEYGLYSSYVGCLIYVILGTCRQATIGPTAVMALLTFQFCGSDYPTCAILTGFYSGIFELAMAFLQLGWVVSFISDPVTVGFTAGAATTIISSQIKSFLGISGSKGKGLVGYWQAIVQDIHTINAADAIMGFSCFIILLGLRKLKDIKVSGKETKRAHIIKTILWLISLSRNAIIVLSTSTIAYFWQTPPFKLTGNVRGGFPEVKLPPFQLPHRNGTISEVNTFWESWSIISVGPIVIAVISVLQNVAISKAFGSGQAVDATQEMFALGMANFVGGFFSCIPTSASFSRSAVNEASGVRSPLGGFYTGILVLLSLGFLTPSFYYIPKASLAAVIICAVMFMIEFEAICPMWRISKVDFFAFLITYLFSIFLGMEYGIGVGVAVSVGAFLLKSLHPEMKPEMKVDEATGIQYLLVKPANGLNFPSVDHISTTVQKLALKHKGCKVIVISFSRWNSYDYTAAKTLVAIVKGMKKSGKLIVFVDADEAWTPALQLAGLSDPPFCSSSELTEYLKQNARLPLEYLNVIVNSSKPFSDVSLNDDVSSRLLCSPEGNGTTKPVADSD